MIIGININNGIEREIDRSVCDKNQIKYFHLGGMSMEKEDDAELIVTVTKGTA